MEWIQKILRLKPRNRGFHLIQSEIEDSLHELALFRVGICHLFLQHTSASLSINENADPSVRRDLDLYFQQAVPDSLPFEHSMEGPDDMPAHVKSSLLGSGLVLPVSSGRLHLGTWQGIYLCEHRSSGGPRQLVATIWGEKS